MELKVQLKTSVVLMTIAIPLAFVGAAQAQDPVNLRMTTWSANEAHMALFNEIAATYQNSNPHVTVTFEPLPFDNYTTTLTTQIAGGNAPDLAWIFETSAKDFVTSGALVPLTDRFNAIEGYDLADVTESARGLWQRDGQLYAYPFSTSPFAVFVNTDLITAAGAKSPAELIAAGEWSWENAMASARAVADTGKDGIVIRDFNFQNWQQLTSFFRAWGADSWSADGKSCGFNTPEMVDALTTFHNGIFKDGTFPGPGENVDFFTGDAAMTVTQISRASLLPKEDPFNWDLVPLPTGKVGSYSVVGQAGVGALASGKNVDAAVDFLAFWTNEENSAKLAKFFPPARAALLNTETLSATNPLLSPEQIETVVVNGIATGSVVAGHTNYAQIQQNVRASLDALWVADADVAVALDNLCSSVSPLLMR